MRELAVQSASDTNTDDDRTQIQNEIDQLTQEVDRIANTTEFNTKKLLNGEQKGAVTEKLGTFSIEGTFANSKVKIGDIDTNADEFKSLLLANDSNVIRIEVLQDGAKGDDEQYDWSASSEDVASASYSYKVTFLHNPDEETPSSEISTYEQVSLEAEEEDSEDGGKLTLSNIFGTNEEGEGIKVTDEDGNKVKEGSVEIKIENSSLLKAGDVITITLGEAVQTEPAKTGKDALRLQIGANAGQEVALGINSMRTQDLDIADKETGKALDVSSQNGASLAVNAYDMAIQKVSTERAKMGAMQNRLEHTVANLDSAAENTQNSESRIRDTDMASQMVEFSKSNILAQAGQSMLAQANQSTQGVLSLLG
jgi:flagellin